MFSYLRKSKKATIGVLELNGTALAFGDRAFDIKDLEFSVEKLDSNKIEIVVRKKRFVKNGEPYVRERSDSSDTEEMGSPVSDTEDDGHTGAEEDRSSVVEQEFGDKQPESL